MYDSNKLADKRRELKAVEEDVQVLNQLEGIIDLAGSYHNIDIVVHSKDGRRHVALGKNKLDMSFAGSLAGILLALYKARKFELQQRIEHLGLEPNQTDGDR